MENHLKDVMRVTAVERHLFWENLWADDKFPKNIG